MDDEIGLICGKCRPKIKALLRTRPYYSTGDMLRQFKSHIWPYLEGSTGAIPHAAATHINKLDALQRNYCREIGISKEDAFAQYRFAPLRVRMHIAAPGIIHKCVLGEEHPTLAQFFVEGDGDAATQNTRASALRHSKQVTDHCEHRFQDYMRRSIFGCSYVYNLLPQAVVDSRSVSVFQKWLTHMFRADLDLRGACNVDLFCSISCREINALAAMRKFNTLAA